MYWRKFKKMCVRLFLYFLSAVMLMLFRLVTYFSSKKNVVFIDIDNTIAHTWPTLHPSTPEFPSETVRLLSIPPLFGSLNFIEKEFSNEYLKIFLTHRPYHSIPVTIRWLSKQAGLKPGEFVFFVQKPQEKLLYFQIAKKVKKLAEIVVLDDLSHSHEKGTVSFYQDIIDVIFEKGYRYIGYNQILALNPHLSEDLKI
jgi:hypothetical protein